MRPSDRPEITLADVLRFIEEVPLQFDPKAWLEHRRISFEAMTAIMESGERCFITVAAETGDGNAAVDCVVGNTFRLAWEMALQYGDPR